MTLRRLCICLGAALSLAACNAPTGSGAGSEWTQRNGDSAETAYSRLDAIDAGNVGRLGLAWSLDLPGESSLEATPLAVEGTLYFTGAYADVYAVDGASGKLLWKHEAQTWKHNPAKMPLAFAANRGAAYADGRVFAATLDGRLLALDAKDGSLLWNVETVDPRSLQTVTGAPRVFNGKVVIGQGGADLDERGYVAAYDQKTGKQVWRFHVVPASPEENRGNAAMEAAAKTWNGEFWKRTGGGGGPWDSLTFDAELNRIYVGTANASPYDPDTRSPGGGDNLYTASIVALDADTGAYAWHYQVNPRDSWDYDCTQQMTLATLEIGGKPRKVLMQAPKNGFFYVLDRETGKVIAAEKIGKATWAEKIDLATGRPVEAPNIRYETGDVTIWPNPTGAHSWQSMSFSPKTGLVYVPLMQNGVRFTRGEPIEGGITLAGLSIGTVKADPRDGKGSLVAWDPVAGKAAWTVAHDTMWNGGTLATAGNLVFQGTGDGWFSAYDARTGKRLWRFDTGLGVIAAPMAYTAGGRTFIALLVGYGGSASAGSDVMHVGWKYRAQPRRLLVFALDGTASLPPSPKANMRVDAVDDPAILIDPAQAAQGKALYLACTICHGRNLVSAGAPAPDLRESALALDPQAFRAVVKDGALIRNGMPRFESLTDAQVMALYAYVRSGARAAKTARGQ